MRRVAVVLAVLLLAAAVPFFSCAAENPEPPVNRAAGKRIIAVGTIEPQELVDVGAQVAGRIVSLGADPRSTGKSIDYGSPVEAGTILAQLDKERYAARVERQRAAYARAEAELAQAKINLERADLQREKASPFDYRLAQVAVRLAEAVLMQSKASLKEAELDLSYTTIRSPIKGVILDRRVNVGQSVVSALNAPSLFLIADIKRLDLWASIREADVSQIHSEQPVRFTVDALPGQVFAGKVKQVRLNATMVQNMVTYTVVISISGATEKLLPYLTARVEFEPE
jgi:HlyD family secretion protein